MTPYPHLHKIAPLKPEAPQLYSRTNLSTLRKLTLPSTRSQLPFLGSHAPKSNTDRKAAKAKAVPYLRRPARTSGSIHSNFKFKQESLCNVARNELFRERNSVPGKGRRPAGLWRKSFAAKGVLKQRSNQSLYSSGKNQLFGRLSRGTGTSLGGKEPSAQASPKLTQLKSELGRLKQDFDRKISRENAKFMKEFDKFDHSDTQCKYAKPKMRLVQREGQESFGMKAFPKVSFSRAQVPQERFSVGLSVQMEKPSQSLAAQNTLQQLEKVRVFDVRSKWFRPKKSTNFSEKVERRRRRAPGEGGILNGKKKPARERKANTGLMLSLRKKIAGKGRRATQKVGASQLATKQKSIDLYSKLKTSQQKSQKSAECNSPGNLSFYQKILR